ncbi:hypothetical protein CKO25_04935 [Thiocapsa imhoffii]|uniref:DUF3108 domain-containing protein n=1 Tax=Thiocapsa imhoffii TaxID=382777 RepID=A0A9X0WG86_9GAMM|nr:DUF6134 family protein [Thiocapsa imhoffii]MBK1644010.1 hypothetical protein [Thiocapsa imhoffii]
MMTEGNPVRPDPVRGGRVATWMICTRRVMLTLLASIVLTAPAHSAVTEPMSLQFAVYLDRNAIGEHRFEINTSDTGARVSSHASFDINFWIFNAYRYRHESQEIWQDGCLRAIEAVTDDNGQDYRVVGERNGDALRLLVNDAPRELTGCIMTFAYWDPNFLKQDQLLNPQTGEFIPVQVTSHGMETVRFGDAEVPAARYTLQTDELNLDLWYSEMDGWLALESDVGRGRILRYERIARR